jgi:DNA-binding GntR family transcriptional regulator
MHELETWQELADQAAAMAVAAVAHDWDALVTLDEDFHAKLRTLKASSFAPLSVSASQEKTRLITQILACQHQVRDEVEPWMKHVQPLLAALSPHRSAEEIPAA